MCEFSQTVFTPNQHGIHSPASQPLKNGEKIEMKITMKRKSENVNKKMKRRTLMFRRARGILHALGCYGVLFREEVRGLFLQSSARVDVHEPLPARLVGEAIVEAFAGLNRLPDPDELAKPSPRPPFHAQRR